MSFQRWYDFCDGGLADLNRKPWSRSLIGFLVSLALAVCGLAPFLLPTLLETDLPFDGLFAGVFLLCGACVGVVGALSAVFYAIFLVIEYLNRDR